ncbi:MAG: hypothetical protein ACJ8AG_06225 [Ktedonobacteraceae bacterium]
MRTRMDQAETSPITPTRRSSSSEGHHPTPPAPPRAWLRDASS